MILKRNTPQLAATGIKGIRIQLNNRQNFLANEDKKEERAESIGSEELKHSLIDLHLEAHICGINGKKIFIAI